MAQGKEWDKDKIIYEVLKPLFKLGYSVRKACMYAGIPNTTVDTWLKNDPELRLEISVWQNEVNIKARKNLVAEILGSEAPEGMRDDKASITTSHTWLRSREKEDWTERSEVVSANISYEELKEMQEENIAKGLEAEAKRKGKEKKGLYDTVRKNPKS
jgi:hypothetical protein